MFCMFGLEFRFLSFHSFYLLARVLGFCGVVSDYFRALHVLAVCAVHAHIIDHRGICVYIRYTQKACSTPRKRIFLITRP